MGKVIPIQVVGRHTERFPDLKVSATSYLAKELAEIINEMEAHPEGRFTLTISVDGYPPSLLSRIQKLLDA